MLAPDNVIFETKCLYHLFQRDESIFASSKSALNIKTFLYVSWKHLPHFCSEIKPTLLCLSINKYA